MINNSNYNNGFGYSGFGGSGIPTKKSTKEKISDAFEALKLIFMLSIIVTPLIFMFLPYDSGWGTPIYEENNTRIYYYNGDYMYVNNLNTENVNIQVGNDFYSISYTGEDRTSINLRIPYGYNDILINNKTVRIYHEAPDSD